MHQIDDEYSSEELVSDSEESDVGEGENVKAKCVIYRKEHMCKDYKFEVGMEFSSLQDFKDAIKEHSVLNGRQVKFLKNDKRRVRVVCKQGCDGLIPTFEDMLDGVEHRFCLRHLYCNFKKKFGGGTLLRDLMMGAAKATFVEAWDEKMQQIKKINSKAYDWLNAVPPQAWCKHAFSFYPKCNVLMNNLSEAFNSTILLAREKPILTMFEWIRSYVMGRFATLMEKVAKYDGNVMPKPRKRLDKEIEKSRNWFAIWVGNLKFEVTHSMLPDKFIVDLACRSCSCNFWDLVGIPCRHVVAAITYKCEDPEQYVHRYYLRETYVKCYDQTISPINGPDKWPRVEEEEILPPLFKRGPGRSKMLRRKETDEDPAPTKFKRTNTKFKCSRCHSIGHTIRKCPIPTPVHDPVDESQSELAIEFAQVAESIITTQVTKTTTTCVTESVGEPASAFVAESVSEPVVEPVSGSMADPVGAFVVDPTSVFVVDPIDVSVAESFAANEEEIGVRPSSAYHEEADFLPLGGTQNNHT
uniref:SWIM-type domain-containing protein n=1 Tax=Cajanus cajan TaxID=3821 RepID=A0A151T9H5_CAJCA|nr:hypothetical protein KK1_018277 [Cajanus cajan]